MSLQSYEYGLRPHDGFKVYRNFFFNHNHLDILNRLYVPLIGTQAIGVYHYMNQFVNESMSETLTHYTIMNELRTNLLEFRKSMDALEAIGLIKTYVKHNHQQSFFIYELIKPPTAYQFFNDPMLSVYLYNEVDNKRYKRLKAYFEKDEPNLEGFQQVTRKFTDVFKVPQKNIRVDSSTIKKESSYVGIDLSNETFEFDMLKEMLQHHFISSELLTKETRQLIIQLATLYGLTPDSMKRIILNSITSDQQLSFEEMRKHARSYYLIEHNQQLPELQVKTNESKQSSSVSQNEHAQEDVKTSTDEWFDLLEATSPIDMLSSWSESEPTLQQKRMIEELIEREKLSFGVINILLQFVMLKNDMKLPKTYIFEIASNWKKLGIKTAQQAYNYALKTKEDSSSSKSYNSNQSRRRYSKNKEIVSREKTPKWLKNRDQQSSVNKDEHDAQLEKDREAFRAQLAQDWEED
ncbi:DnaD domain protein [Staphylococcus sp. NRL 16/872]|uniref:replication initiation and membrane attachment family protein n=1 Tax=Staphylococcus sp. NRL 16/872 TaxID=2930131 RepID=UPI001FB4920A|nr:MULTISPECIES: DnaD domain protein [unclassified Staphylococcus]MCJ1656160.1 DnaD domain protein [Staphylococcus sp. NRL 21/187]MCJ1661932.1 DnaD domain protein [Staphylococcus sp. NRL 18/288]MCJ1667980.1 DnaD domain protein [Staphylococcus sp. NRL 19/737]WEN70470.1 DnaD domain protein [Staphylococcus sp. NRL 16/872]